jgi:IrrE N-terminal-like domain
VKSYRSADGEQRLWYEDDEIERIMEDELRRAELFPDRRGGVVDVEALIERHLAASLDQYADLPVEVLGLTEFVPGKPPQVRINSDLTGSAMDTDWCPPGVEGRWRATLAHEAAHVVLHRTLFDVDLNQGSLFPTEPARDESARLHRCLKRDVAHRTQPSDWREVQANRGMAALLMPRSVFTRAARRSGAGSGSDIDAVTRSLAELFAVSRQATTIRLRTLGFIRDDEANSLFATN